MESYIRILDLARMHKANAAADINNASNRLEHIRLTALAQEASNLLTELENFGMGLVYSHSVTNRYQEVHPELDGFQPMH